MPRQAASPPPLSRSRALGALALTSAVVVAHEVLMTRLLSVVTWYGLSFFVLSVAMLGLTAGSLQALRARASGEPLEPWLFRRACGLSVSIVVSLAAVLMIPLIFDPNLTALAALLAVAAANALPMTLGGGIVTRLMSEVDAPIGKVYAVDLAAAAAGALVPLALLGPLDGPSAIIALAVGGTACAALVAVQRTQRLIALLVCVELALFALANNHASTGLGVRFIKDDVRPRNTTDLVFEGWNALSSVEIHEPRQLPLNETLWAASPAAPAGTVRAAMARIDGEAGTYVYPFEALEELDFLKYDVTNVVHWLRPTGQACVIGVGGGRDLASALLAGHDHVLGVEVNPLIIDMLKRLGARSPILSDPRVEVVVGDGRSVLAQRAPRCQTLQASLVDTWAATGAGAFAHTEATLYTRQAWALFLERVAPNGVLTFSRWYSASHASEASRLVALTVAALLDRGVAEPARHFAIVTAGNIATLIVSPAPLSSADLATLHARAGALRFDILLAPDVQPSDETLRRLHAARTVAELVEAGRPRRLDTSPPTDDRPFFFQLLTPRAWLHPTEMLHYGLEGGGVISGNVLATVQLFVTFGAVTLLAIFLLGPALWRAARAADALPGPRAGVYFGALGAGFMLAEISLVQRMHVALGHPTYALVVVLAGLLVSTGVGSALSTRVVRTRRAASTVAAVAGLVLALLPHVVIAPLAQATAASSLGVRVAWTGAASALVGLLLGMLFPSGVRFIDRERGVPLALALNGTTSVLGSVLAVVLSVGWGIPTSFAVAGAFYMLAAWAGPHRWRGEPPG